MDNKQDRKFYWEVKDFLTSQNQNAAIPASKPKVGIADQAKIILERNQPFPTKPLEINNNTLKATCQAIGFHQKQEAGYNPSSKAFSKNNDTNAFRTVNEGFWDDFKAGLEEVGNFGTNIIGKGQGAGSYGAMLPMNDNQARQNASLRRANQSLNLDSRQLNLQQTANPGLVNQSDVTNLLSQKGTSGLSLLGDADRQKATNLFGQLDSGKPLTSDELLTRISRQSTTPGVPLTPEQKAERDLAGKLKREEGLERIAQDDVEAEEAGSQIVRTSTGREYGLKPSTTPTTTPTTTTTTTPASVALGKPATPGVDTEGSPSSLSGSQTSSGPFGLSTPSFGGEVSDKAKGLLASMDAKKASTTSPAPTSPAPTSGRSPEQKAADREKRQAAINQRKREKAERRLAYLETLDSAQRGNERPEHTAMRAASIKRLQQDIERYG